MSYIKLHRDLLDHWIWQDPSKLRAWIYLLSKANYEDSKVLKGSTVIEVKRGQVFTSQMALAKQWGMARNTVASFLRLLENEKMLSIQTSHQTDSGYTLLTITNYDKFQGSDKAASDTRLSTQLSIHEAITEQSLSTSKNIKKNKEVKETTLAIPANGNGRDEAYDYFAEQFNKYREIPYRPTKGDFVQLASLRKALGAGHRSRPSGWEMACTSYFESPIPRYTLADLCSKFDVFKKGRVNTFGRLDVPEQDYFDNLRKTMGIK